MIKDVVLELAKDNNQVQKAEILRNKLNERFQHLHKNDVKSSDDEKENSEEDFYD